MIKNFPTISICTIVKNEESNIDEFFGNVLSFTDEIIVIDTGSVDDTINKIEKFLSNGKIKFFQLNLSKDFHYGKAKNFSIKKSTQDFIVILDADERLSDKFKDNLHSFLVAENPMVANVDRIDEFLPHFIEKQVRIIKNGCDIFYGTDETSKLHEQLKYSYVAKEFLHPIIHRQGINHWLVRPQRMFFQLGLEIDRTPKTKSFLGHFLRGLWYGQFKFKKVYFHQRVYKDGWLGFKYAFLRGFYAFLLQIFVGLKPKDGYKYWEDKKIRSERSMTETIYPISQTYKIYNFILTVARFFSINNFKFTRNIADAIKGWMRSHAVPFVVSMRGFRIRGLSWMDYVVGAYEPETTKLFDVVVKDGQTIIDIGADYGYFSLLSAKLVGSNGKVFAFEPYAERCEQYLRKNIALNNFQNIEVMQKAASNSAGKNKYFADSRSLFDINATPTNECGATEDVESVRLDDFFRDYSRPIDLIKIDVEGGEMNVLKGAYDILERNKSIKLILEIHPQVMQKVGVSPANLLSLLRNHKFILYWINEDGSVNAVSDREIISRAEVAKYVNIFCSRA